MHTLYSGCTPQEKCELIERIWKLEKEHRIALKWLTNVATVDQVLACTDEILKGRQP